MITAHGISDRERSRLKTAGKTLIDTTCPLVKRAHQAAQTLQAQGYHVIIIGRKGHVEINGIMGDLDDAQVIEAETDVRHFPHARLGVICQTTATERHVTAIRAAIVAKNPDAEIRFVDTVCLPTKDHQRALERLLGEVDAMVVVGGRNSNNTRALAGRCRERDCPVLHVESAAELDPAWFKEYATVGLTAGTSTMDHTIEEVHRALVWIGSMSKEEALS
jgi:4-hydroxy-3-methylbut-2-enyl diphosphate reductase